MVRIRNGRVTAIGDRRPGATELRMMIAAPVDYDPREFIVHLYISLCELVRRLCGVRGVDFGR